MDIHGEIQRSLGRIEGKLDAMKENQDKINIRVDSHETFINNLRGKVAVVAGLIAATTSILTLWIKKHFNL